MDDIVNEGIGRGSRENHVKEIEKYVDKGGKDRKKTKLNRRKRHFNDDVVMCKKHGKREIKRGINKRRN